jgi:alpha-tubulin suppressor-like RCC1 family protein
MSARDSLPPETNIHAAPDASRPTEPVSIEFSASEAATFECRLGTEPFQPCTSPFHLAPDTEGVVAFQVRAIDAAGNVDLTPATHAWVVGFAPNTHLEYGPPARTPLDIVEVRVSASFEDANYYCSFDGGERYACPATMRLEGLGVGQHTLEVAAHDGEGHVDETPVLVTFDVVASSKAFAQVSVGDEHACAIDTAGALYCWGRNDSGQLGDGSTLSALAPVRVAATRVWTEARCGREHSCAISDSTLYSWGNNQAGQLGLGDRIQRLEPEAVALSNGVKTLTLGDFHTCITDASDAVACFGLNVGARLGDGSETLRTTPTPVAETGTFLTLAAGGAHTCALRGDSRLACWGRNQAGQLGAASGDECTVGQGKSPCAKNPVLMPPGTIWTYVVAGPDYTCALDSAAALYCWGDASRALAVDGPTIGTTPRKVFDGLASVSVSMLHGCGVSTSGMALCWGSNANGQLGIGSAKSATEPVAVGVESAWASIDTGAAGTCGIRAGGSLWCWGDAPLAPARLPSWVEVAGGDR